MTSLRQLVRGLVARRLGLPEIPVALRQMRAQGFAPDLIIDVGAHRGEFARLVLDLWRTSHVICIEPLPEMASALRSVEDGFPGRVQTFQVLLGAARRDSVSLHVADTASSVLTEHYSSHPTIAVPMDTLDSVVSALGRGRTPDLIKIDVQGYELEVLRGAVRSMSEAKAALVEVNLIDIHVGVALLHELIAWMAKRDFVCFDICGLTRRPLDGALWQADMIFVPIDSPLRADRHWAKEAG